MCTASFNNVYLIFILKWYSSMVVQTIIIRSQRVEQHQITRIGIIFDSCLDCHIRYSLVLFKFGKNGFLVAQSRGSENLSLCEVVPCVLMHR